MTAPFPMPNDTSAIHVESRQHELFGIDLGEGIPRVTLKVAPFFYLPWWTLLFFLGVPLLGKSMIVWILPPTLALVAGLLPDAGDRMRLITWFEWLAWVFTTHPPIVNGDTVADFDPAPIVTDMSFVSVVLTRPIKKEPAGAEAAAA